MIITFVPSFRHTKHTRTYSKCVPHFKHSNTSSVWFSTFQRVSLHSIHQLVNRCSSLTCLWYKYIFWCQVCFGYKWYVDNTYYCLMQALVWCHKYFSFIVVLRMEYLFSNTLPKRELNLYACIILVKSKLNDLALKVCSFHQESLIFLIPLLFTISRILILFIIEILSKSKIEMEAMMDSNAHKEPKKFGDNQFSILYWIIAFVIGILV